MLRSSEKELHHLGVHAIRPMTEVGPAVNAESSVIKDSAERALKPHLEFIRKPFSPHTFHSFFPSPSTGAGIFL